MFDLFVPYVIGLTLGLAPSEDGAENATIAVAPAVEAPAVAPDRAPEPQVATGQFTTAVEVKPILGMTKGNWVAVRDFNGQDLLYFTHLMSWRCGLWDVSYGLNGAPPDQFLSMEPCHLETNSPNAMTQIEEFLPYVTFPPGSVDTVTVALTYDDGTTETATFQRNEILIP